jgi:hypothetical protein
LGTWKEIKKRKRKNERKKQTNKEGRKERNKQTNKEGRKERKKEMHNGWTVDNAEHFTTDALSTMLNISQRMHCRQC